jgi:hypothetical protein
MNPPETIIVAGHPFKVELVTNADELLGPEPTKGEVGRTEIARGRMRIRSDDGMSEHNVRDTVLHETIHAVLSMTYLDQEKDVFRTSRQGERLVDALGTNLLDTLRRNPDLVRYLMDGAW